MLEDLPPIEAVGTIYLRYDPMSPETWGLVPFSTNVSVYKNAVDALIALKHDFRKLAAKKPSLESSPVFFRGQPDVTFRLLPTRLRPLRHLQTLGPKSLNNITPDTPPATRAEIRRVHGTWNRTEAEMRSMNSIIEHLPADEVQKRDEQELAAIAAAKSKFKEIAQWELCQQRAAVRHYGEVPSSLVDVSDDIEVAAFMATAFTKPDDVERYGVLWAVDLRKLKRFLGFSVTKIPGGERLVLTDRRDNWGINRKLLDKQNLPLLSAEILNVELPLPRPTAQKGKFLSLTNLDGSLLSLDAELRWWSIIERWSYAVAFVQTGEPYENLQRGITRSKLLPADDPYLGIKYVA